MKNEKEKWMENVLQSMKGSQRAKPSPKLFEKIKNKIGKSQAKIVSMYQWRSATAAAVLVLLVNATAIIYYNQNSEVLHEKKSATEAYSQSLITSYQIYE